MCLAWSHLAVFLRDLRLPLASLTLHNRKLKSTNHANLQTHEPDGCPDMTGILMIDPPHVMIDLLISCPRCLNTSELLTTISINTLEPLQRGFVQSFSRTCLLPSVSS